ncbi:MAG TPA: 4-alpha-glucanotransferase [Gaiellaceae bacterium]|nr:4-alpha-glucanotransferase [Gaiellaceae bacterium]
MRLRRSCGILLHPASLPSGRLGRDAYRFVDWLAAAGQSWWQVLPLGPPDEFGSPYRSPSAFAASPQLLEQPDARVTAAEVEDFVARHPYWTGGWAAFAGGRALADQVRFEREWEALRGYARSRGIRLIGDVPIYVSGEGADVAAWPELFEHGEVAGAPPDSLSANGQRWGNPLYDWPAHRATGYRWWRERFRRTFELVDVSRVDHFRGFVSYWAIPERHRTAKHGRWRAGPGAALFRAVERDLGDLPVIAEDLGRITPPVWRLRDELGLPGMVVLHWAFGGGRRNPHRLENHREREVVYTSTHDTDTTVGWFRGLRPRERAATGLDPAEPHWGLIELAYSSPAELAIVPAQDVLGLGEESRMNRPGVTGGNWSWQLRPGQLTPALAARLRKLAEASRRAARAP